MTRFLSLVLMLFLAGLPACSRITRPGGDLEIHSLQSPATLTPAIRTACYRRIDSGSADLYFSDLPESRLADADDDLAGASGSILQIHLFLEPSAGNTPIDDTACNAIVRHVVLAQGAATTGAAAEVVGVYGGGGFFYPSGSVGDEVFGGSIRDGTHRLTASTPGFKDLLGPASLEGKLVAARDDDLALAIQSQLERLIRKTKSPTP